MSTPRAIISPEASRAPLRLASRTALPEHGWVAEHGPLVTFDALPRFARWSIVTSFAGRLAFAQSILLLWVVAMLCTSFLIGVVLLPLILLGCWSWAPWITWKYLVRHAQGPFRIRIVDEGQEPHPHALTWEAAPRTLIQRIEGALLRHTAWAQFQVSIVACVLLVLLNITSLGSGWRAMLLIAGVLAISAPAFYRAIAKTFSVREHSHSVALVA